MKRILSALLTLAAAATLVFLPTMSRHSIPPAHAESGCTDSTLTGNYGFTFNGFQIQHGTSRSVPFVGGGVVTFDGAGNASASFAASSNGTVSTNNTYAATYTVNSDCTASMTATPGSGGDNFALVILGGGAEVLGVDTSTRETLTIDLKKQ